MLLERLVSDPGNIASVLDEASRQTERRIRAARRYARRNRRHTAAEPYGPLRDQSTSEPTAAQVLRLFRRLRLVDMQTSQPPDYDQWERLAKRIESVRRRILVNPQNTTGTFWDRNVPDLTDLLNPVVAALVEEFLQKLVQMERLDGSVQA